MSVLEKLSDAELRDVFVEFDKEYDGGKGNLSDWALDFIESICYKTYGDLTKSQREKVIEILEKYTDL